MLAGPCRGIIAPVLLKTTEPTLRRAVLPLLLFLALALGAGCGPALLIQTSVSEVVFADTPVGDAVSATITVDVLAGARADFTPIFEPPGVVEFQIEPGVPSVIEPGEPLSITVWFIPQRAEVSTVVLGFLASNVQGRSRQDVALRGLGLGVVIDGDRDGSPIDEDCDDEDPATRPGADELCDGLDNDCDGSLPADEADADGDGFRLCGGDCDDADADTWPGAEEICDGLDNDCDEIINEADADADGVRGCDGDCDDANPDTRPGAVELCDGYDNNCDGVLFPDELDGDLDGFRGCGGDCDDLDDTTYPGAPELCDGLDNDCDGSPGADEPDLDGDGVPGCAGDCDETDPTRFPGNPEVCDGVDNDCDSVVPADEVDADSDTFLACGECDDADATSYPFAPEVCDGVDNDCDTVVPADEVDVDSDGFLACAECDDAVATTYPAAPELCDGVDNDCDTVVPADEVDADADGFLACAECDDTDITTYPAAPELCDGVDNDCDTVVPADETDDDGDGAVECTGDDCDDADPDAYVGNTEDCEDAVDSDCDGTINQGCTCPIWAEAGATTTCTTPPGSFGCPYPTAQAAVDATDAACSTVWLKPGTFTEALTFADDLTLFGLDGAATTILDGGGSRTITVSGAVDVDIEGVSVTGGSATDGGGLHADGATVMLQSVVFDGNQCGSEGEGGGLYCEDCTLDILDSTFVSNTCGYGLGDTGHNGGGLFVDGGDVFVTQTLFDSNAAGDGGAVFSRTRSNVSHIFTRCSFYDNAADDTGGLPLLTADGGGAIFFDGNVNIVSNSVFGGNSTGYGGGAAVHVLNPGGNTTVENNVMLFNSSSDGTLGFSLTFLSTNNAKAYNNIIAFNTGAGVWSEDAYPPQVRFNNLFGNSGGTFDTDSIFNPSPPGDNINVDPMLAATSDDGDWTNEDWALSIGSPCIDAGNPATGYNDPDGTPNDMGIFGGLLGGWSGP